MARVITIETLMQIEKRAVAQGNKMDYCAPEFQLFIAEAIIRLKLHDTIRRAPSGGYALWGWNTQWVEHEGFNSTNVNETGAWENTTGSGGSFYGGVYRDHHRGLATAGRIAYMLYEVLYRYRTSGMDAAQEQFYRQKGEFAECAGWMLFETPVKQVWLTTLTEVSYRADEIQTMLSDMASDTICVWSMPSRWGGHRYMVYTYRKPKGHRSSKSWLQTGMIRTLKGQA